MRSLILVVLTAATACGYLPSSVGSPLSQADLKYRVVDRVGPPVFCDPDLYPIARGPDEPALARRRLAEIRQQDPATYQAIMTRHHLSGDSLTDAEAVAVYYDLKMLNALQLTPDGDLYRFQGVFQDLSYTGNAFHVLAVKGSVDKLGNVKIASSAPGAQPPCPICLAAGTLIETPLGPRRVSDLAVGDTVWTADAGGARRSAPIVRTGSIPVPAGHEMASVSLADGRHVEASPGHPTADGRRLGDLAVGDVLDGSPVVSASRVPYTGIRTFDIRPSGPTGAYWADGVLLGSTLAD